MNLDAMQAMLIIILAFCFRDGILAWLLIGRILHAPAPVPDPDHKPVPPGPGPDPKPDPDPVPPKPDPKPEPVGTVLTFGPGKCSWFGGPNDSGSGNAAEGLALVSSASELPGYFLPDGPGLFRRLDPNKHYIACRWDYSKLGKTDDEAKAWLRTHKCTVTAEKTGKSFSDVQPVDWGPNVRTGRIADLSPGLLSNLGITTDDLVTVTLTVDGAPPSPAPTPITPTGLVKNVWPTQAECPAFYGDPSASGWEAANLVSVTCPWELTVEGTKSHTIRIHRKCAASLDRIFQFIWSHPAIGQSQSRIHEFGYDVFDGSYNFRQIRGGSGLSMHSYGIAMDWNAAANPQHAPLSQTRFKADPISLIVFAFEAEGWIWGGRWSPASIDAMHFQAARVR